MFSLEPLKLNDLSNISLQAEALFLQHKLYNLQLQIHNLDMHIYTNSSYDKPGNCFPILEDLFMIKK